MSDTLETLFLSEATTGRPVRLRVLMYDRQLPWAGCMARAAGVLTATLFSQLCSVGVIYRKVYAGRFDPSVMEGGALRGLLSGGSVIICGSTGVIPVVAGCSGGPV